MNIDQISKTSTYRLDAVSQTIVAESCGTSFSHPDALESLFKNLSDGQTPNFLEMIAALSDVSVIMTPPGNYPDCHMSPYD